MNIWDGNKNDTTNFETDKYLQINSCGFQNALADYRRIRVASNPYIPYIRVVKYC